MDNLTIDELVEFAKNQGKLDDLPEIILYYERTLKNYYKEHKHYTNSSYEQLSLFETKQAYKIRRKD